MRTTRKTRATRAVAATLLLIAACGDSDSTTTGSESDTGSTDGPSSTTQGPASDTATASQTGTNTMSGTETGGQTEATSGPTSESTVGPTTDSTSNPTATDPTSATDATTDNVTVTDTDPTTGPTCEDTCMDGVCVGDVCCALENACGDECCNDGDICTFESCQQPGAACVTGSDCAAGEYCDYSLGEQGDMMCAEGSDDTGQCMPLPADCGDLPDPLDPDVLDCLPPCAKDPTSDFDATLKYTISSHRVMMPPIVLQLDDDNCDGAIDERDDPEVVYSSFINGAYNNNGTLRAASIDDDGNVVEKWAINPQSNRIWPGRAIAGGDLDGQPGPEIVVCTEGSGVRAFHADGSAFWVRPGVFCDMPSIADLDGDGNAEVLLSGNVLDGQTGNVKFAFAVKNPNGNWWREHAIAVDVDVDPELEIVTGSSVYDTDGALLADTGLFGTYPAAADLDADGEPEIVVVANRGKDQFVHHIHVWRYDEQMPGSYEIIREDVNINGNLSPFLCPANSNGRSGGGGAPTIAEFDGDGTPDVGVAGGIGYAVFSGKDLMDSNVANADTLVWIQQTQDCSSSFTGSSVYDFNGNGRAEVVYADEEVLRIYQGTDGSVLAQICNTSGTLHEYPLVTDLDHDGHADLVVASNNYSSLTCPMGNIKTTGVRVFSNVEWTRTRTLWNQHAYHVTNIDDDGTIPATEPKNWLQPGLNNFRQNYIREPSAQSDLVITDIRAECGDPYTLVARVRNIGRTEVPAGVPIGFYAGDPDNNGMQLGQVMTTKDLYPAEAQDVKLPAGNAPADVMDGSTPVFAVADDGMPAHTWTECRPENNKSSGSGMCM